MKNSQRYAVTLFAMRGRPTDGTYTKGHYTQRMEVLMGGYSNTITSVTKDNLLLYEYSTK